MSSTETRNHLSIFFRSFKYFLWIFQKWTKESLTCEPTLQRPNGTGNLYRLRSLFRISPVFGDAFHSLSVSFIVYGFRFILCPPRRSTTTISCELLRLSNFVAFSKPKQIRWISCRCLCYCYLIVSLGLFILFRIVSSVRRNGKFFIRPISGIVAPFFGVLSCCLASYRPKTEIWN